MLVNDSDVMHMFDWDMTNGNKRYAMVGQAFIHWLEEGDQVRVKLHSGAIKGGGLTTFTSFLGLKLGGSVKENMFQEGLNKI